MTPTICCPHCESTAIAWTEHETLESLHSHATTVKCGDCEETYSVEYEATVISYYTPETDQWTTTTLENISE